MHCARLLIPALIVALDLSGASPALAQGRVTTLEELGRELSPGDFILVVQTTGESVRGRLLRFGDQASGIAALDEYSDVPSFYAAEIGPFPGVCHPRLRNGGRDEGHS